MNEKTEKPFRCWKRIPSGGTATVSFDRRIVTPIVMDSACPDVVVQGTVGDPLPNGDRLVTLFLVNGQTKPDENQDQAWIFQPELIVPFQLAFLLLSIPSLADPTHPDRVQPVEAYADLLWFPTGGGKTEAYLGVAAFTMAIRRMQGNLGGYDGSRGLAVIMRYTLRLLTLQQFQRATALICAMEVLRREALAKGDESLGTEPFTIGLWVGNKVTPGTTEDSHRAIEDIREPRQVQRRGGVSGATDQLPLVWLGSRPGARRRGRQGRGRTFVYCGDKKGRATSRRASPASSLTRAFRCSSWTRRSTTVPRR
jgi:hypothetical protein